jgi:hypothetical protein
MFLIRALAGIASLFTLAEAADTTQPMDLGSVLGRHPKLSTYYKLIQVRQTGPSQQDKTNRLFLEIPRYPSTTSQLRWCYRESSPIF